MFQSPNNSTVMGSVPTWHLGIASGILAAMRNVGMVLGLAVVGAVFYELAPVAAEKQLGQPFSPPEIEKGAVYRFSLNHVVEPDDPLEMFRFNYEEV